MAEVTSEGVNEYVKKVQDRRFFGQRSSRSKYEEMSSRLNMNYCMAEVKESYV
jgi:hypothetical protein